MRDLAQAISNIFEEYVSKASYLILIAWVYFFLNDVNEPIKTSDFLVVDSFLDNSVVAFSAFSNLKQQSNLEKIKKNTSNHEIIDHSNISKSHKSKISSLYFDASNSKGFGVGCILMDMNGNKTLIACRFEFDYTNNVIKYKALIQGLNKTSNIGSRFLKYYGDSEIIIR